MEKSKTIIQIVRTILEIFNEREINKIAYNVGFIRRSRKLTPLTFLALCVFHSSEIYKGSLAVLCNTLRNEYKISVSENGLNERFTVASGLLSNPQQYLVPGYKCKIASVSGSIMLLSFSIKGSLTFHALPYK
jgi:hypothetical protein